MRLRIALFCCVVLALTVGVAVALGGDGGNAAAAKGCQKDGWKELARSDGSAFKNQGDCVFYAAQGGTLQAKCAGSEDFSAAADRSQPTTFSGGTIDTTYGSVSGLEGGIVVEGTSFFSPDFATGTHLVFSGNGVNSFKLTFTRPVGSVALDETPNMDSVATTNTLTAYDASNQPVGADTFTSASAHRFTVTTTTNSIKYFTIATDDPDQLGIAFTNIIWTCH